VSEITAGGNTNKEMEGRSVGWEKPPEQEDSMMQHKDDEEEEVEWEIENELRRWEAEEEVDMNELREWDENEEVEMDELQKHRDENYETSGEDMGTNPLNKTSHTMMEELWDREEVTLQEVKERNRMMRKRRVSEWQGERKRARQHDYNAQPYMSGASGVVNHSDKESKEGIMDKEEDYREESLQSMEKGTKRRRFVTTARWTAPAMLQMANFFQCLRTIRGLTE
jgi:hypothetical protein